MPNRGSWVEINLTHLKDNLRAIQKRSGAKLILPVKADAYGHGAVPVTRAAIECGVDFFCVANIGEAIQLREHWVTQKILLIVPLVKDDCEAVVEKGLRPTLSDMETARFLGKIARNHEKTIPIHLEVDTGMSRGGIWHAEFLSFYRKIQQLPELRVEGLYTHFASADEGDLFFTEEQQRRFLAVLSQIQAEYPLPPIIHNANSAAILQLGATPFSHVRPGISVYGYYSSDHIERVLELKPVMACKTELVHIQPVQKGRSISYNRTFFVKRDSRVGIIDIGYADGFSRALSNRGEVLIRGRRAPIIGTVCMDMAMIDLTDLPEANLNDEVVIIGRQEHETISADDLARDIGTINYEIVTLLGMLNKRVFFEVEKNLE